jgi:hypothetical protein
MASDIFRHASQFPFLTGKLGHTVKMSDEVRCRTMREARMSDSVLCVFARASRFYFDLLVRLGVRESVRF